MVDLLVLQVIANAILVSLRGLSADRIAGLLQMQNYHGFGKARLGEDFLQEVLRPFGLNAVDVQAEVIRVNKDLRHQVHFHREAFAYVVVLGEEFRMANPKAAEVFLGDSWSPVRVGQKIQIPAGTRHGFTVDPEQAGILYFLSVQAPPIVREDGHDDYHHD